MNIYTTEFKAVCPNNELIVTYTLRIETNETVMVETIIAACHQIPKGYHEHIASEIYARIGAGRHILIADHHGVRIETRRGFSNLTPPSL